MKFPYTYINRTQALLLVTFTFLFSPMLNAQHNWEFNPADYGNNGEVNLIVILNGTEVSSGTVGVFVGNQCRGIADGKVFPVTGKTVFSIICFSNESSGEILSFKYYDNNSDKVLAITETVEFKSDMILGLASDPLIFNAWSNSAPLADCPDYSGISGHPGTLEFNACDIFSDPDGDDLLYSADVDPLSTWSWTSACELNFTAADNGTSSITITATDGEFSRSCSYSFTVDPTNEAPIVENPIEEQNLLAGFSSYRIDLNTVFSDPDGDALTFKASSSNEDILAVQISDSDLIIEEKGIGSSYISINASDGSEEAKLTVLVIVRSEGPDRPWDFNAGDYAFTGQIDAILRVNSVEVTSGIIGAFVGDECRGIIEGAFFAPTGKTIFSLLCNSNLSEGEILTFKYYHPNDGIVYNINENIEFESDMIMGNAVSPIVFNIDSDNNLPRVSIPVSDKTIDEHFDSYQISLAAVFTDPDNDPLNYSAESSDEGVAIVSVEGTQLTVREVAPGISDIIILASDGKLTTEDRFVLTIEEVNDPPEIINPVGDLDFDEGFRSIAISLVDVFSDPESDDLTLTASSGNSDIISVYIAEQDMIVREEGLGTTTIYLCADDGEFRTCETININVVDINDPPLIDCSVFNDTSFIEGFGSYHVIGACSHFSDKDEDALTFTVTSSNTDAVTASLSGWDIVLDETGTGSSTIKLCASDGELSACCAFEFTVVPENEIILQYDGLVLENEDSIMISSAATELIISVGSDLSWTFKTFGEWIQEEIVDNETLKLICPENITGDWRMGLVKITDEQEHVALFYVHQSEHDFPFSVEPASTMPVTYYPNPAGDILNVELKGSLNASDLTCSIVSSNGALYRNSIIKESSAGIIQIDLSGLEAGLYLIKIDDKQGVHFEFPLIKK